MPPLRGCPLTNGPGISVEDQTGLPLSGTRKPVWSPTSTWTLFSYPTPHASGCSLKIGFVRPLDSVSVCPKLHSVKHLTLEQFGRVGLGWSPPRPPTDPDVQFSSIRFFTSPIAA